MKKLFAALVTLFMLYASFAEEAETLTEGQFSYTLTDEGAVITKYLPPEVLPDVVEIPAVIGGHPVVDFGYVFSGILAEDVHQVILAEGIFTLGNAFLNVPRSMRSSFPHP